jgi:hypothetical protein
MPELRFRVFFNNTPATADDLLHIDEISVEQTEDAAWEARLSMVLCLNSDGHWDRQSDIRLRPRTPVRIELQIGTAPFKPLIDGPIVGVDTAMDSRPGRSTATVVVHDNSAWLNLEARATVATDQPHAVIVRQLFTDLPAGATILPFQPDVLIPDGGESPASLGVQFAQLGTPMQKLRELARRNGCHVYVLPGAERGTPSVGCFKGDPEGAPTLPPLVVLGASRNLTDVIATEDPESSAFTTVHTLRLGDQQIGTYTTQDSDQVLLGPRAAAQAPAPRQSPPSATSISEDARAAAAARDRLRNYPVKYTGRLIPGCYPGVLQPYQKVALHAGAAATSAVLLLTKVTHRITPSMYTVEFEGRGNSLADLQAASGLPLNIL